MLAIVHGVFYDRCDEAGGGRAAAGAKSAQWSSGQHRYRPLGHRREQP